jgi:hypothetical protein
MYITDVVSDNNIKHSATQKGELYQLWTNERKLIATNKSRKEIDNILFKYYVKKEEQYICKCLLCKNGIPHSYK